MKDKERLQNELNEISKQIYELKDQLKKEKDAKLINILNKKKKELQYQALWYMMKLDII